MTQTSASNERQIRTAKERAKRDDEISAEITRVLMSNPEGRRWMWLQLAFCRAFAVDAVTDPGPMAYEKGLRTYGMKLFSEIGLHAARFLPTMMEENSNTIKKDQDNGGSANDPE